MDMWQRSDQNDLADYVLCRVLYEWGNLEEKVNLAQLMILYEENTETE